MLSIRTPPPPVISDIPESEPVPARPMALVTVGLIALNVIIFFVMIVSGVPFLHPTAVQVLPWGGNLGPYTTSGQWWRLLTACFLHFGILHLVFNMIVLFQIGIFTEILFGSRRFLALYLVAGIGGNIAGLYLHPITVSAGASGAIFGLYGGMLAFLLICRGVIPSDQAMKIAGSAAFFLLYNFLFSIADVQSDFAGHVGGLLAGFVVGCLLAWSKAATKPQVLIIRAAIVSFIVCGVAIAAATRAPRKSPMQTEWIRQIMSGPSIAIGKQDRLMYGGAITHDQAAAVAKTLTTMGFFRASQVFMLLRKDASGTVLSIPFRGDETLPETSAFVTSKLVDGKTVIVHGQENRPTLPWENPATLNGLRNIGPIIASAAGGPPLVIRMLNGNTEVRKEIRIDAAAVTVGAGDTVVYSGAATEQDARNLGAALQTAGIFKLPGVRATLTKGTAGPEVSFYIKEEAWNKPGLIASFQVIGSKIASSVGGPPVTLHLVDPLTEHTRDLAIR